MNKLKLILVAFFAVCNPTLAKHKNHNTRKTHRDDQYGYSDDTKTDDCFADDIYAEAGCGLGSWLRKMHVGCIDGELAVPALGKGDVKVSSLQVGDKILGISNENKTQEWCTVQAKFKTNDNASTFDGFTPNHLLIYDQYYDISGFQHNDTVVSYAGKYGKESHGAIYSLMTDCDATYSTEGDLFTPISSTFCPAMPWSDYLSIMAAIRRIAEKTGYFWFDLAVYYNNKEDAVYNSSFIEALPELCNETLQCSKYQSCERFEKVAFNFVTLHLNQSKLDIVQNAFPNIGNFDPSLHGGTLSATVGGFSIALSVEDPRSPISIITITIVVIITLLLVAWVAFILYRNIAKSNKLQTFEHKVLDEKEVDMKVFDSLTTV